MMNYKKNEDIKLIFFCLIKNIKNFFLKKPLSLTKFRVINHLKQQNWKRLGTQA
jgi:hypothetical protein